MQFFQVALLGALTAQVSHAYSSSLADCEAFASLWAANCGGTDSDAVYATDDWETTGAGQTIVNCAADADENDDDDLVANAPETGEEVSNYTIFARNCITCRENDTNDDKVMIRYQSNNMPKRCYGRGGDWYPMTQKIDFEVAWNLDVLNKRNIEDASVTDVATTDALLCNDDFSTTLPDWSIQNGAAGFSDVVGFTMNNVAIGNALTAQNTDILAEYASQLDSQLSWANASGIFKQFSWTSIDASTTKAPGICADYDDCLTNPVKFALNLDEVTEDTPTQTIYGLAKDGHIIVGPYNSDGELWSCDDTDICNGVFLADNSYAYATTTKFPYVVGCWGPGPQQEFAASCTERSCSGAFSGLTFAMSSVIALLLTMTQF